MSELYKKLAPLLQYLPASRELREILRTHPYQSSVTGLVPSLDALVFAEAFHTQRKQFLLIAETDENADRLYDDLVRLLGEEMVALFTKGTKPSAVKSALHKAQRDRDAQLLEALERITGSPDPLIIIASHHSLAARLPAPNEFEQSTIRLTTGSETSLELLAKWLRDKMFEEKQFVESNGDFARRGGIIDVFPYTETVPFRIEFFGDMIESIREFDTISQRSIAHRQELALVANTLEERSNRQTILDYVANDAVVMTYESELLSAFLVEQNDQDINERLDSLPMISISSFARSGTLELNFNVARQPNFGANMKLIRDHLHDLVEKGTHVYLLAESRELLKRLEDLLEVDETLHDAHVEEQDEPEKSQRGKVSFLTPSLAHGFVLPAESKTVVYTEHELFGRKRDRGAAARKRTSRTKGISMRELRSLKRGDLLVHEDKGIGKFMGLDTIEVRGTKQEVVRLVYRDNDVLFVNLDYIQKLSRYSAADIDTESVQLSKLGSGEWARTRERTKKRLKDIARNLIKLYAKRKSQEGFAFNPDDVIQQEMEAAFLYEDTPDQAKATEEVKSDMVQGVPMDRLICGDVGYGKTEVAMRAAMKATLDKKQVAVLVPTTILAEQHYRSFSDRLERFGVSVAALSRFRTAKETKEILAKLADGKIDILIGTHRILSKDVIFKDLGLLIVDEEHRFGVAAKEKLRELRTNVDTLTLTATPIPRTLNFSLLGARDLSVIETPPKNRLPVATEILTSLDEGILRTAIMREMERGGQIYAINDKVYDIENFANKLREIAPRARIGTIHGQMPPAQIEKVMRGFLERKVDILCATKIVESGLDVPNANTIIINNAHNFGLAELYQLRGRVGRSNEQAYCYLVTRPIKNLSRDALRRLEAMEEFSELGAGFQLAMRDMEIRGAGNLLGAEQSGFINEIGFDLYQKTLAEAVDELKEEEFKDLFKGLPASTARNAFIRKRAEASDETTLALGIDALIPEHYIEDDAERFAFYQRLSSAANDDELEEIRDELDDRFGALPEEVEQLITATSIRLVARQLGFRSVAYDDATRTVRILLPKEDQSEYYHKFFPNIIDKFKVIGEARVKLQHEKTGMRLIIKMPNVPDVKPRLAEIRKVLTILLMEEEAPTA